MICNLMFAYCPSCESRLHIPNDTVNGDVLRCSQCTYLMKVRDNNVWPYRPPHKFISAGGGTIAKPGTASMVKTQPVFPQLDRPVDYAEVCRRATNATLPFTKYY